MATRSNYARRHRGFTLIDMIVAAGCTTALLVMCISASGGLFDTNSDVKCGSNLKQMALSMLMYANNETKLGGTFPRTFFDWQSNKLIVDNTGYGKKNSFDRDVTGTNNVTASFFLVLKSADMDPKVFVCPATSATPGFPKGGKVGVQDSANWEAIPQNLSYSYACPFPTKDAIQEGWKWNNSLGSDTAIIADMNPGSDALLKLTPQSPAAEMAKGNSRNHRGRGQNVAYADGHVDWQTTPFCGYKAASGNVDNIYTVGGADAKEAKGIIGQPVSVTDMVLLPVDSAPAAK